MSKLRCPNCGAEFDLDEGTYYSLLSQVRDDAFQSEMQERLDGEVEKAVLQEKNNTKDLLNQKDTEIIELNAKLAAAETEKKLAVNEAVAEKDNEINKLQLTISNKDSEHRLALQLKDEQIAAYKDFKAKQSVKMLGEDLEQYCWNEFEKNRISAYQNAYFEKDNDTKKSGTKGDFIFRDYDEENNEFISIMFEMKNEADETASKHKNASFFEKLDKDRKAKDCEYAVLVTTLEAENDLYNSGIFEVPQFEKMFVVRPQHFLTVINLLRSIARQSLGYKQQLVAYQLQNLDIENFITNLNESKAKFGKVFDKAQKSHSESIEFIDKAIAILTKARDALTSSDNNILLAENRLDEINIMQLTKGNPTMKQKFLDAGVDLSI